MGKSDKNVKVETPTESPKLKKKPNSLLKIIQSRVYTVRSN